MNLAHDDDGIIDLRALKSTPPPRGAFPMVSPFGSEPPPAAFARDAGGDSGVADVAPARASKAKTIGIAAGAALFLILGAVGVAFAFRGEKPRAAAASAPITQPAPPPVVAAPPAPVVDPAPAAAAQPAASSDDDTSDAPPAKKGKGAKGRAGTAKAKTSFSASSSPASAPKPAVTKAADPCHCHGDFQCNIRCSAAR